MLSWIHKLVSVANLLKVLIFTSAFFAAIILVLSILTVLATIYFFASVLLIVGTKNVICGCS